MLGQATHEITSVKAEADHRMKGLCCLRLGFSRKTLRARKQIELGTYNIERRLDVALERILLDLS